MPDFNPTPTDSPAPQTNAQGTIKVRAFPTEESVAGFVTGLIQEASDRLLKAGRVMAKLDQERPHSPETLRQAGLAWKSNFTTRPLSTLISQAMGRFPRALQEARYLTNAALPADIPGSLAKTEFFRDEFSKALRSHPKWDEFIESAAFENVVHGWCGAGWLDEDSWFPTCFEQDSMFVPTATRQISSSANAVVLKTNPLPSEAWELLRAAEAAKDTRWKMERLANAINKAMPEDQRSGTSEYVRLRAELDRSLQNSTSYMGSKVVTMYHVLAVELNSKVSHYILDAEHKTLFSHEERFESIAKCLTFFAFERGDRRLQGSKGIARAAWTLAGILDRARNDAVDRLQLSGKLIAQTGSANKANFAMSVVGNVILIDDKFLLSEAKVDGSPESAIMLDKYLQGLMDTMTGSTSQQSFEGRERVTKEEVQIRTLMAGERVDDYLIRWLRQMGYVVSEIQDRALNPALPDSTPFADIAKKLQARLLERLTPEELEILRKTPAISAVVGWTKEERSLIVSLCSEGQGNPMYDQHALAEAKAVALVGPEFAKQVVLAVDDPTVTAEQTRTQMFENDLLLNGQPVPVSPRDAHEIHLTTLLPMIAQALQEATRNATADTLVQNFISHGMEHVAYAKKAGQASEAVAQAEQTFAQVLQQLASLKAAEANAQATEQDQIAEEQQVVSGAPAPEEPLPNAPLPQAPAVV